MASTVILPVANALKAVVETVVLTGNIRLKGYTWEPREFDKVPAGAVGVPDVRRTGLDEPESQLGSDDWFLEFPVSLYFDLDHASKSQGQAVEGLEAFVAAIDANPDLGLGGVTLDCKVTRAEQFAETGRKRTLIGYQCTVSVWRWVN